MQLQRMMELKLRVKLRPWRWEKLLDRLCGPEVTTKGLVSERGSSECPRMRTRPVAAGLEDGGKSYKPWNVGDL